MSDKGTNLETASKSNAGAAGRARSAAIHRNTEAIVSRMFREAGYEVTAMEGPFHLRAKKGGACLFIRVAASLRNAPKTAIRNYLVDLVNYGDYPFHKVHALCWHHCYKYDKHTLWEYTFKDTSLKNGYVELTGHRHPLAHMIPKPLDKNSTNRQRRAEERRKEKAESKRENEEKKLEVFKEKNEQTIQAAQDKWEREWKKQERLEVQKALKAQKGLYEEEKREVLREVE